MKRKMEQTLEIN